MAAELPFASFCGLLDRVATTSKTDAKLKLIFSPEFRAACGTSSLYPFLRLLLPHLDRDRTYKLKEKKLAALYVELLGLSPTSADGKKLLHWTDPTIVTSRAVGDFAMVLAEVMTYRSKARATTATLGDINTLLDALNAYDPTAALPMASKKSVLLQFITQFSGEEQKWLVRIVLKDLKIGLRHERVLQFMHPDAVEMFNHTNDLERVCRELTDSRVRYVPAIAPFQVFTPMLAKRVPFGECTQAMGGNAFYMEPKLDGERITCHVQHATDGRREVQLISRNGINYTDKYGPCIAPYIDDQVHKAYDCILDGEMLVWDSLEFKFQSFGSLKTVAVEQVQGKNPHQWLCYVVWDIVYLHGGDTPALLRKICPNVLAETANVMGLPLSHRLKVLDHVLISLAHRVERIEQTLVSATLSPQERHERVMTAVDARLMAGYEGLILKDATSHYMCGESSRKSQRWIKLKPDYAGMTRQLDVLVIGGYYGSGARRGGAVSHFLLGVLERAPSEEDATIPVVSFCKVGTGYTIEELDTLRQHLAPHWQSWDPKNLPAHFQGWTPKTDTRPDVWIAPEASVCIEVFGFELTYTTEYQTGLTLRFPRLKAVRYDKSWSEALTLSQLNTLKGQQFAQKRAIDVALGHKDGAKRPRTTQKAKRSALDRGHVGVALEYTQANLSDVQAASTLFSGCTFCVLPGKFADGLSKQTLEQLLHAHGATCVQNPHPTLHPPASTWLLAATMEGLKVRNYVKQGIYDILKLNWILRSIDSSERTPWRATDYLFATEATTAVLQTQYDIYGDHYTTPATREELDAVLRSPAFSKEFATPWQEEASRLDDATQSALECPTNFFWHCVVYVDQFATFDHATPPPVDRTSSMHHLAQCITLFGGRVVSTVSAHATHVVLPEGPEMRSRLALLRPVVQGLRHSAGREPVVVTTAWAQDCIRKREQLPVVDSGKQYQIAC
ncbi:DNA ligase [Achlya hypogyna]|uniref:DNA ligase n=1 Tax=Achlya hypogyna TaxID=1202772 RepID=A0A1V9YY38_ACHHY|nr:DNA ligase [Achlya hypogyna]